ncbi:MAG TPA: hypothetical protein VKG43_03795 [Acidimicrobiales bacterium]|nr:hypothetical protein [Acidimicrobiales bacterium]
MTAILVLASLGVIGVPRLPVGGPSRAGATQSTPQRVSAYWLVAKDGGIFAFGGAGFYGSTGGMALNKPIVGMAGTADSAGYWLVASDGGIFSFGDAGFYGSTGNLVLNEPVVGMAATPDGHGYWLVAKDGGIFAFGDAAFYGSTGAMTLNQPVVGMAATADGHGYWLVASDGGIFAFGDAAFYGSTGNLVLNEPVVGMVPSPNGAGYTMVARDGGIFAFGKTSFYGSLGGVPLARPVVSMALTSTANGYWFTDTNGAVSAFGGASYWGSAPQVLNEPIVAMAQAAGTGQFSFSSYPSGSYGYDVSNWQCNQSLPSNHTIGVVEVVGASFGSVNPCLAGEAAWAAGGLNLYVYLTYGTTSATPDPACNGDQACNFGFAAAQDAFAKAQATGINAGVPWWLDVEPGGWSTDTTENAALVRGALDGLRDEGLNSVGIYASPGSWNGIVGNYQPSVAYWMAWWSGRGGPYDCANASSWTTGNQLPTGPVVMVQYADDVMAGSSGPFDGDYAC